ncbi:3-phosphoshikimate 1-carboxyvinyltransferase [Kitasatospora sp. LaBMicrA B282]|uniref:3-phosphoshikimate 1-carboxyvinyltransferase n=1 Tax=Kitasatospora sp. LaBMicrA B282 TaxID=3420949 RepID=UPI003D0F254B
MTKVRVHPVEFALKGESFVPYSKPHMQRAIILSLLTNAPSSIINPGWSSEAAGLFEAARQFGLRVLHQDEQKLHLDGAGKSLRAASGVIPVAGSAFNFRSVAGLACLVPGETVIEGNTSMRSRPVVEHLGFIRDLGGDFEDISDDAHLRIRIRGSRDLGGETAVDTRHSSQVLTSVLLAAPLAARPVDIAVAGHQPVGEGYVDLTVEMMREQGADVERTATGYRVTPSGYLSRVHHIASDFTALSYLAGAVATAPDADITVRDHYPSRLSSELEFFEALDQLGVETTHDPVTKTLRLRRTDPAARRIEIDGSNIPTVTPTLAAIVPFVDAEVTVRGVAHVNNHKCRRVDVMIAELQRMGCDIKPVYRADGAVDGFTSTGRQHPEGGVELDSHGDHRIFMSLATAALGARRPSLIDGLEHLRASFPDYLDAMALLGTRTDSTTAAFETAI